MAVQCDLSYYYRQNEGAQELSPTLQSSELLTPQQVPQRPTTSPERCPKPPAASISDKQICEGFPAEHPYHSHISKYAVFPNYTSSEEASRCSTPLRPQTPASGYPTIVLRKTKGNPYRHEIVTNTSDAEKFPLTWPGQHGYYHLPKSHIENVQIFYPIPPKTVAPNALHKPYEESLSERTLNLQRNLIKSQWLTSYNRSFTGNGEMNPLQLDDFHDRVIGNITGTTDENTEMKPTFVSTVLHARPLEGRIARLRDGRRPLVREERYIDLESEIAACAEHSDKKSVTDSPSPCIHATYANLDACNTTEEKQSHPQYTKYQHKEPDIHKITDTERSEALYRRQLTPLPCSLESKPVYNDSQPLGQDQYMESPYSLSKHAQQNDCTSKGTGFGKVQNNKSLSYCIKQNTLQTHHPTNNHGKTLPRPSLQELQDSFSRSQAHKNLHMHFPENAKDLRENYNSGKKQRFYGFHSFYFHN